MEAEGSSRQAAGRRQKQTGGILVHAACIGGLLPIPSIGLGYAALFLIGNHRRHKVAREHVWAAFRFQLWFAPIVVLIFIGIMLLRLDSPRQTWLMAAYWSANAPALAISALATLRHGLGRTPGYPPLPPTTPDYDSKLATSEARALANARSTAQHAGIYECPSCFTPIEIHPFNSQYSIMCDRCRLTWTGKPGGFWKLVNIPADASGLEILQGKYGWADWKSIMSKGMTRQDYDEARSLAALHQALEGNGTIGQVPRGLVPAPAEEIWVSIPGAIYQETRAVRKTGGGYGGMSFRREGGHRVHLGRFGATSRSEQEWTTLDSGTLLISDKRILFLGGETTLEIPPPRILSIQADGAGWLLSLKNRKRTLAFEVPTSGWIKKRPTSIGQESGVDVDAFVAGSLAIEKLLGSEQHPVFPEARKALDALQDASKALHIANSPTFGPIRTQAQSWLPVGE